MIARVLPSSASPNDGEIAIADLFAERIPIEDNFHRMNITDDSRRMMMMTRRERLLQGKKDRFNVIRVT